MPWLPASWPKRISLFLIALFFINAGISHFTNEAFFVRIVPPWLPNPLLMVQISGVAEIAGGLGILVPQLRRAAGIGLIALLIAVFPANVHMAVHPEQFADIATPGMLYFRLPLQLVALVWTWWATKPEAALAVA
ncbi:MAG TPA: DoxX family protein [Myxococcota bacterium]|nr:DoxX family protein [Myxococcota bacterium]